MWLVLNNRKCRYIQTLVVSPRSSSGFIGYVWVWVWEGWWATDGDDVLSSENCFTGKGGGKTGGKVWVSKTYYERKRVFDM